MDRDLPLPVHKDKLNVCASMYHGTIYPRRAGLESLGEGELRNHVTLRVDWGMCSALGSPWVPIGPTNERQPGHVTLAALSLIPVPRAAQGVD